MYKLCVSTCTHMHACTCLCMYHHHVCTLSNLRSLYFISLCMQCAWKFMCDLCENVALFICHVLVLWLYVQALRNCVFMWMHACMHACMCMCTRAFYVMIKLRVLASLCTYMRACTGMRVHVYYQVACGTPGLSTSIRVDLHVCVCMYSFHVRALGTCVSIYIMPHARMCVCVHVRHVRALTWSASIRYSACLYVCMYVFM